MSKKKIWFFSIFIYSFSMIASSLSQRIIGDNNFEYITPNEDNIDLINSIGMMKLGCTVTHLGNGYALTAGHCFEQQRTHKKITNKPCSEEKFEIMWGKTYKDKESVVSQCEKIIILEYKSSSDYALIKVWPQPRSFIEIADKKTIKKKEFIRIFSYPKKRPLEWSGECIAKKHKNPPYTSRWLYDCDTQPGSSGASLLNDEFKIIGIHNSYARTINLNNGTDIYNTKIPKILKQLHTKENESYTNYIK